METNKTLKERREIIKIVLSNSINSDDTKFDSDKAKFIYAYNRFKSEYGFNIQRIGLYQSVTDWLQGLALDIPFYNWDILKLAKELGYNNLTEKEQDLFIEGYFSFMANSLIQIWHKEKLI